MRKYIFTDQERETLLAWLRTGEEPHYTQQVFSKLRRISPRLVEDIKLYIQARKTLLALKRWRRNVPRSAYGPLLGAQGSTPRRRDTGT